MPPPTTRTSSVKNRSSETPPTSWRPPNTSNFHTDPDLAQDRRCNNVTEDTPREAGNQSLRTASLTRPLSQQSKSNELSIRQHVTRDSMLDNIILSFNQMPDGQAASPKQPPLYSSFKDGEFKLETPCFVYDAISQLSTHSRSSSIDSTPDQKQNPVFSPYQIRTTPIRRSSLAKPRSTGTLRNTHKRSSSHTQDSKTSSRRTSPTPRARLRQEASAMVIDTSWKRPTHRKSKSLAVEMDLGTFNSDQPKWARQRSSSMTKNMGLSSSDNVRFLSSRDAPNNDTVLVSDKIPTKPTIFKVEDEASEFASSHIDPAAMTSVQPMNNFKPQTSSRNKVALITGSDSILAGRFQQSISDLKNRPPFFSEARLPEAANSEANPVPRRTKSHALTEQPKERHGFLRRVFGSSRTTTSTPDEISSQLATIDSSETQDIKSLNMFKTPNIPDSRAPSKSSISTESHPTQSEWSEGLKESPRHVETTPVLHKKASFFRRRKKISDREDSHDMDFAREVLFSTSMSTADESPLREDSMSTFRNVANPYAAGADRDNVPEDQLSGRSHRAANDLNSPSTPILSRRAQSTGINGVSSAGVAVNLHNESFAGSPTRTQQPPTARDDELPHLSSNHSQRLPPVSNADGDVFSEVTPVSSLSAQLRGITVNDAERSSSTPIPSPMSRAEYPASLQTMRNAGLAISSNAQLPILSQFNGSQIVPSPQTYESPPNPAKRIWIKPDDSDEDAFAPIQLTGVFPQTPPQVQICAIQKQSAGISPESLSPFSGSHEQFSSSLTGSELPINPLAPTQADVELATRLYFGDEDQGLSPAELLGQPGAAGERLRQAYMDMFDLDGVTILSALRQLCGRLTLRGESQQIGRILASLSQRWCECHQYTSMKHEAIVNSVFYALLLLNTDLHIAELDEKMSRAQFVKNTLTAIRQIIYDTSFESSPNNYNTDAASKFASSTLDIPGHLVSSAASINRPSFETRNSDNGLSSRPPTRPLSGISSFTMTPRLDLRMDEPMDLLLNSSLNGWNKSWDSQIETVLKSYYNSIRQQSLPLSSTADFFEKLSHPSASIRSSTLKRSGSAANRVTPDSNRGRVPDRRTLASRWNPRNRSKGKASATSTIGSGRTSVEDGTLVSPSASSTWSKAMTRTQTSASSESFGDNLKSREGLFIPTVGFARALNQAMERVKEVPSTSAEGVVTPVSDNTPLEDEVLMLAGAPWAKEGIVSHKHHLEAADKKARERNWIQCFAVVEKGNMRLFSFTSKASVRSQKNKSKKGGAVGGGNWTESAEQLELFPLRHTLAAVMPSPGHKDRPFVFSLRLSAGAVHFFQVGTPEIAEEFVSTINYWSARSSKEPLVGGVSNIEYGWSEAALDGAALAEIGVLNLTRPTTGASQGLEVPSRLSFSGSVRSSFEGHRTGPRLRYPGDRLNVADWTPPAQNLNASTLAEADQLAALTRYTKSIREDLVIHNDLRANLMAAYSVRHPNHTKAMANWEKKSAYLLTESTKFSTYVDSLNAARRQHEKLRLERDSRLGSSH